MTDRYFTKQTLFFLSSLSENNTREWFEQHKTIPGAVRL